MASASPASPEWVRRLVEGGSDAGDSPDVAAVHAACERFYGHLARWTGVDGCHALFARARSIVQAGHPALTPVEIRRDLEPHLGGVGEAVETAGAAATAAALEALLTRVLEQLGRLIGHDMVTSIVNRAVSTPDPLGSVGSTSGEAS